MTHIPSAIDVLQSEHRLIESVLVSLREYASQLSKADKAPQNDLNDFVEFLQAFADAQHHAKEEEILFEAMIRSGFPRQGGPIPVMLQEHDEGRRIVDELNGYAQKEAWSDEVVMGIARASNALSELLRTHIHKEDNVLYEMAKDRLSPTEMEQVDRACAQRDDESRQTGRLAALETLAARLIERYGGPRT